MTVCLNGNSSQDAEERHTHVERLGISLGADTAKEGATEANTTAEQRQRLHPALELLAAGTVESMCFTTASALVRTDAEVARLERFLSENHIGLTVTERKDPYIDRDQHRSDDDDRVGEHDQHRDDASDHRGESQDTHGGNNGGDGVAGAVSAGEVDAS